MEELWNRLRSWLTQYAPEVLKTFNPPASFENIERIHSETRGLLPDLYEFLQFADGQDEGCLLDYWGLLSSRNILYEISLMKYEIVPSWKADGIDLEEAEVVGPIKLTLWDENWIPILSDGGNLMCLDLVPEVDEGGKIGQVIQWWRDGTATEWVSSGFKDWFSEFVESLEQGQIVLNSEGYALTRR